MFWGGGSLRTGLMTIHHRASLNFVAIVVAGRAQYPRNGHIIPAFAGMMINTGTAAGLAQKQCSGAGNDCSLTARTYAAMAASMLFWSCMKSLTKRALWPGKTPNRSCITST